MPNLMIPNIKIISAGAGSGKTFRLTNEMVNLLKPENENRVRPAGIIATTFTNKAAAELQERVRIKLLEEGLANEADQIANALIGTVHGLGVKLLKRFALEAGVSPQVDVIAEEDQQKMFNNSLAMVLHIDLIKKMEELAERLGLNKNDRFDWRKYVKNITDKCRENNFSLDQIEESKQKSINQFFEFVDAKSELSGIEINQKLVKKLAETLDNLNANVDDGTKVTTTAKKTIKEFLINLKAKGALNWYDWAKIYKLKVGAKSKEIIKDLQDFSLIHEKHPQFHLDIAAFISTSFEVAISAIIEYEAYKKSRGLIDYTDMESLVLHILNDRGVHKVLSEEIDLLLVDEFQDTSPMQLEIFLKLSSIAKHSIWVGDPKQSIYGFRGAEPDLMLGIVNELGGVQPEDIQEYSWRSREDLVNLSNAIFCKAFEKLPNEHVQLKAKRTKSDNPEDNNFKAEPIQLETAVKHWHFQLDEKGRTNKVWSTRCIAENIRKLLEKGIFILPKESITSRKAVPGDIAVLCRSNEDCKQLAKALQESGLNAAISQEGLLKTTEITIILACLKYILNQYDSLSVAEILLLLNNQPLKHIVEHRIEYLNKKDKVEWTNRWASENEIIKHLNQLRTKSTELSGTEILNIVIEELDLRRVISKWGNVSQRLDNLDALRKLAKQYEEGCNRLHTAASLGGLILWLNGLVANKKDLQGAGKGNHAVNVLTYHKSKGLEWPIVLCYNLENGLRDDLFGAKIVRSSDTIDIKKPLANSWLRFWINPYADQKGKMPIFEKLDQSPIKKENHQRALEEEIRLLYVGITRARDYLILPSKKEPTKWFNRVCNKGDETTPILNAGDPDSPWNWISKEIPIDQETYFYPKNILVTESQEEKILFQETRKGMQSHDRLEPDKERIKQELAIVSQEVFKYAEPLKLDEGINTQIVIELMTNWMKIKFNSLNQVIAGKRQEALLNEFLDEKVKLKTQLTKQFSKFYNRIKEKFDTENIKFDFHFRNKKSDQIFEFKIDIFLQGAKRKVIMFNSTSPNENNSKKKEINTYLIYLKLLTDFFEEELEVYVNYLLSGEIVKIIYKTKNH